MKIVLKIGSWLHIEFVDCGPCPSDFDKSDK